MIPCQLISYGDSAICIVENRYSVAELLAEMNDAAIYQPDLKGIKTEHRKREFLAIRLALKKMLGGEEKQIEYSLDGKPVLKDESYKISFSHCQNAVAAMLHPRRDVGIDIEVPSQKLERIHTRFLGESELAEYRKHRSIDYLRVAWSVKEALYKIIGETAYNFAEQLQLLPFTLSKEAYLHAIHTDSGKKYRVNYLLTDRFTLAYCIDNE